MDDFETNRYAEQECIDEFLVLFPHGFGGDDVIAEVAPQGWERSPLLAIFHPSLEQVFQESVESHQNLQRLRGLRGSRNDSVGEPPPTIEQVRELFRETSIEPQREVAELVGRCLWDVFSDNHDVLGPDGRRIDIGSFRGAGGFIADELNRQYGSGQYDYMDFYMGTAWITCRADVTIVYELIFKRFQSRRLDWVYQFPKLNLIDLRPLREVLDVKDKPEWEDYSPETDIAKQRGDQDREQRLAEVRGQMEDDHARTIEQARTGPPPRTVVAYESVYGGFPCGWPP